MIVAIQTARAGSKSVPNKNITLVKGKPLYLHPIDKVKKSKVIEKIFITTDCQYIKNNTDKDVLIIDRPSYLSTDKASHHDVMIHAINHIESLFQKKISLIVFLLGNSLGSSCHNIEKCIKILKDNKDYDSIQSVSKFNMFNPYRAFKIKNNFLNNFIEVPKNSNDKNFAGDIFFNNGSFFICRRNIVLSKNGLNPFPWLGHNIYPFIEETKMEVDDHWQLKFIKEI